MRGCIGGALVSIALGTLLLACASDEGSLPRRSASQANPDPSSNDDGGVIDSGVPAPITTAGPDPQKPDPCAGRRLCDSFESQDLGAAPKAPWKARTAQGGKVEVVSTKAFTGSRSVKVTTGATQFQQALLVTEGAPLFALPGDSLYGRMMVWLEQPAADGVHWTMLSGDGPVSGKSNVSAGYRYGGQLGGKLMANYDTSNASTDCWQHSQTVMPIGKWVCFSWKLTSGTNEMQIAIDGKDVADLHVKDKGQGCIGHDFGDRWLAPTFASASVGWESYQQDVGHTMYVDDVVLDAQPVSCP